MASSLAPLNSTSASVMCFLREFSMDLEEEGMGKWPLSAVGFPPNVDINCFNLFCCSLVSSR